MSMPSLNEIASRIKEVLLSEYDLTVSSIEKEDNDHYIVVVPVPDKTVDISPYWILNPVSFSPEGIRFRIVLSEFEERFGVIGEKSLTERAREGFLKDHADDCESVTVEEVKEDPEDPTSGFFIQITARLKPGVRFVNDPWLALKEVKDKVLVFEVFSNDVNDMYD